MKRDVYLPEFSRVIGNCWPILLIHHSVLPWLLKVGSSQPRDQPRSPTLQVDSLPSEPLGKPKNAGVGRLSLLQWIFLTQKSNWISCIADGLFTSWASREALRVFLATAKRKIWSVTRFRIYRIKINQLLGRNPLFLVQEPDRKFF